MFKSFFPNPKWFFGSLVLWFIINCVLWYSGGNTWGQYLGFAKDYHEAVLPIGVSRFWSAQFIWFYLWFFVSTTIFAIFWKFKSDNPWQGWSVCLIKSFNWLLILNTLITIVPCFCANKMIIMPLLLISTRRWR